MNYWVYILACKKKDSTKKSRKTYYVGSTNNLQRRIKEHKSGKSRYTKSRIIKLVYCETVGTRADAYHREFEIKRLTKKEKEGLIKSFSPIPEVIH
ncbi:MAG: GIY-YIG nuclease family protein [Candidatus Thorarchaeota archaeon]